MPFTAFPHQINDPIKLRKILKVVNELLEGGEEISDASLGYTLFLKGIIRSREQSSLTLREQLAIIERKAASLQSPLSIARDIRSLFELCGLIQMAGRGYELTDIGRAIVSAPERPNLTAEEKKAWLKGLWNLTLQSGSGTFRPLKIMLEILAEGKFESRSLAFAFTASDESEEELRRIKTAVKRIDSGNSDFETELESSGITPSNARNSVKIIPALAEHLHLIIREGGVASITPFGRTLLDKQARRPRRRAKTSRGREPFFRIVDSDDDLGRNWKPEDTEEGEGEYDPQDEKDKLARLRERTDLHQETLDKIRRVYIGKGWRVGIGNFDLLAEKDDVAHLHEVKTLAEGDVTDERLRIIDGVGKLFFYEEFDVPSLISEETKVQKIMVFNAKPNRKEHIEFLSKIGIWSIWFDEDDSLQGEETALRVFKEALT